MTEFLKEHKKGVIIGICVFIALLIFFFIIYFVMPSFSSNKYGNRLDKEAKYKVVNSKIDEIKDMVKEEDGVTKVTYHKEGRILNFIINFDDGYNLDSAKTIGAKVIESLSDKNKKYYDIQIFLNSDSEGFPTIGYKAKGDSELKWGNVGENSES